jgi:hypothetical protein
MWQARTVQIPKLIVRVRFPSPAPYPNPQLRCAIHLAPPRSTRRRIAVRVPAACPIGALYASRQIPSAAAGPSCRASRRAAVPVPHGCEGRSSLRRWTSGPSGSSAHRVRRFCGQRVSGRSGLDSLSAPLIWHGFSLIRLFGDRGAEDRAKQPVGVDDRDWPERRVLFRAGLEFDGTPGPHFAPAGCR